jgi:hypothetical protein
MLTVKGKKIMNIGTSFVAIVSLLLALAAADIATKEQSNGTSTTATVTAPNRIALNHNETMVSDAPVAQDANFWSRWVTSLQAFFSTRPKPGGCDEFGCGMNHNETMVSDAPLTQMNNAESVRQFQPRVELWQPWEHGIPFLNAQL